MDIDYLQNVQISAQLNNGNVENEFTFNLTGLPSNGPPDECIIRQISFITEDAATRPYCIWSDINSKYVASFVAVAGGAHTNPSTRIKLNNPLNGQYTFKVFEHDEFQLKYVPATGFKHFITLNLEFIRYKK